jgi:hypothetical protein
MAARCPGPHAVDLAPRAANLGGAVAGGPLGTPMKLNQTGGTGVIARDRGLPVSQPSRSAANSRIRTVSRRRRHGFIRTARRDARLFR